MAANPRLDLPESPRVTTFRLLDQLLRSDPVLANLIRPTSWQSWEGTPADSTPLGTTNAPAIRLTPQASTEDFWAVDSLRGQFYINVELIVPGFCWDDLDNLWYAVQRAIYPFDKTARHAITSQLQRATGGAPGVVTFTRMANFAAEPGEEGFIRGAAQMRILVNDNINV